jgi:hypothetical protein
MKEAKTAEITMLPTLAMTRAKTCEITMLPFWRFAICLLLKAKERKAWINFAMKETFT